ncbi:hypothetical protein Prudu_875S000200 [Prunus dulcis]|uniref:Uncharacterized protein n=1 Tax=Prunus dulcis TaxID=3755 RepID=A0A5H2XMF2_PRUDU|nr:hypothetical protein Prudu_875S000200 [Prunus dulcis]
MSTRGQTEPQEGPQEVQLARTSIYMFLNHCGYPVTETGCRQIRRCLRTSRLPSFMLPFGYDDVYRHAVYFQLRQCT